MNALLILLAAIMAFCILMIVNKNKRNGICKKKA